LSRTAQESAVIIASDNLRSANEVTRIAAAWLSERAEARPIVSVATARLL
jgi:hypothetical protein